MASVRCAQVKTHKQYSMKSVIRFAFTIALVASSWSCSSTQTDRKQGENGVYNVEEEDPEMLRAIAKSRETFPEFLSAYRSNDSTIQDFAIKVPFKVGKGHEHIWLNKIRIEQDKILGVVNNQPEMTEEVTLGDTVVIDRNTISDWNYIKGNKLYGGYSVRLLRNRMTPEQRDQFDQSTGLIIE